MRISQSKMLIDSPNCYGSNGGTMNPINRGRTEAIDYKACKLFAWQSPESPKEHQAIGSKQRVKGVKPKEETEKYRQTSRISRHGELFLVATRLILVFSPPPTLCSMMQSGDFSCNWSHKSLTSDARNTHISGFPLRGIQVRITTVPLFGFRGSES